MKIILRSFLLGFLLLACKVPSDKIAASKAGYKIEDENLSKMIYGVSGIPANFLIDKNGNIIAEQLIGEQLEKAIISALKN